MAATTTSGLKTWSDLSGRKRRPTEYEIVTYDLHYRTRNPDAPYELDPNMFMNRWYKQHVNACRLRHDDWKYIWNHGKDSEELYDLKADPDERVNVGAAHPDLTRRYRRQLTALASYQSRRVRQAAH